MTSTITPTAPNGDNAAVTTVTTTSIPRPGTDGTDAATEVVRGPVRLALADIAPFAISLIPYSLAIGSAASANGLTMSEDLSGGVFILAGAAQLAAIGLLGSDAAAALVLATVALINARLVLYGSGINRWFDGASRRQRLALASVIIDQNYVVCEQRFTTLTGLAPRRRYYLAATATLIVTFIGGQIIGFGVGANLPAGLGLHLAAPLVFGGMLVKSINNRTQVRTGITAALALLALTGPLGGAALPAATGLALLVGSINGKDRS